MFFLQGAQSDLVKDCFIDISEIFKSDLFVDAVSKIEKLKNTSLLLYYAFFF